MKAAVLQPYFFPYIGFIQLMRAVDMVVFLDDVQYIKGGWVNRNRIRANGKSVWITMAVVKGSHRLHINQRQYLLRGDNGVSRILEQLRANYSHAPYWNSMAPVIYQLLEFDDSNVAAFNINLLTNLAQLLNISCKFFVSSELGGSVNRKGQARVIQLCKVAGANHYINPIGGLGLYDKNNFEAAGVNLSFLRTRTPPTQLGAGAEQLSIIDWLMHEGATKVASRLSEYELIASA